MQIRNLMQYLRIEYKGMLKSLLHSIAGFLIITSIVCACVLSGSYILNREGTYKPVMIGVAADDSEEMFDWGMRLLRSMDTVKSICELHRVSADDAYEMVSSGELAGAVILPENFYYDMYSRINTPVKILLPKRILKGADLFDSLLSAGVSIIDDAEFIIYAVYDTILAGGDETLASWADGFMTDMYIKEILNRDSWFISETYGVFGQVSEKEYYTVLSVCVILLLMGFFFGSMYSEGHLSVETSLGTAGIRCIHISFVKILVLSSALLVVGTLCDIILFKAFSYVFDSWEPYSALRVFYLIPVCILISCFFDLIYSLAGSVHRGRTILLMLDLVMILIGGCFVPVTMLPSWIKPVVSALPVCVCEKFLSSAYSYGTGPDGWLNILAFCTLFFVTGVLFKCKRR